MTTPTMIGAALAAAVLGLAAGCSEESASAPASEAPTGFNQSPTDVSGGGQPGSDSEGEEGEDPDAADGADSAGGPDSDEPNSDTSDGQADGSDSGEADGDSGEPSPIGGPCQSDADCADEEANCIDWPEGKSFCTILNCGGTNGCPGDTYCTPLNSETFGCVPTCNSTLDCRPGYFCKALALPGAEAVRVCHAVESTAQGAAGLCDAHIECAKEASCVASFAGGYCAILGCGDALPCPAGTACVELDNPYPPGGNGYAAACHKICDAANPCPGSLANLQACVAKADISGVEQQVCAQGDTAKPLGAICGDDDECTSGFCELKGTGLCTGSGWACQADAECGAGSNCLEGAERRECAQVCDGTSSCDELVLGPDAREREETQWICVPTSSTEGRCEPACAGLADVFTCDSGQGERCLYGYPLDTDQGEGAYACQRLAPATSGEACAGGTCVDASTCVGQDGGEEGLCVGACGSAMPNGTLYCPWASVCASNGVVSGCWKTCPEKQSGCFPGFPCECPTGWSCETFQFAAPFVVDMCVENNE